VSVQYCSYGWSTVLILFMRRRKCIKRSADFRLWGLRFFLRVALAPFLLPTALVTGNVVS
jgi:hypothetical protein